MLVGLLASTRLRSGEALRLDRTDVDFDMSTGGRQPRYIAFHLFSNRRSSSGTRAGSGLRA
jgi:integrase